MAGCTSRRGRPARGRWRTSSATSPGCRSVSWVRPRSLPAVYAIMTEGCQLRTQRPRLACTLLRSATMPMVLSLAASASCIDRYRMHAPRARQTARTHLYVMALRRPAQPVRVCSLPARNPDWQVLGGRQVRPGGQQRQRCCRQARARPGLLRRRGRLCAGRQRWCRCMRCISPACHPCVGFMGRRGMFRCAIAWHAPCARAASGAEPHHGGTASCMQEALCHGRGRSAAADAQARTRATW